MNATEKILQTYNKEELKEIADHGCQSGVCSQHIYYGDTIQFYDTFETNILDELVLNYGYDLLNDLFKDANADLTVYKNSVVWAFIEMVAFEAVEEYDREYAMTVWFSSQALRGLIRDSLPFIHLLSLLWLKE